MEQNSEVQSEDASSLKILRSKSEDDPENNRRWKLAKWGSITFCVIHFLYEIFTNNATTGFILVLTNYFITMGYITLSGMKLRNPYISGLAVSCVVFLIRLVVGSSIFYFSRA